MKSNKTSITPLCQNLDIKVNGSINCVESQQWCLCKTADALCCTARGSTSGERDLIGHYTITATQQSESNCCTLSWNFTVSVPCLSYTKQFSYNLTYAGAVIATGTFTLGPNQLTTTITGTSIVTPAPTPTPLVLKVSYTNDTYNLSGCTVTPGTKVTTITTSSPPVQVTACPVTVTLADVFGPPSVDFTLVTSDIAANYPKCDDISAPSRNGSITPQALADVKEILGLVGGPLVLTAPPTTIVYDFFVLFGPGEEAPSQVTNSATLTVSRRCAPDNVLETLGTSVDTKKIFNVCTGAGGSCPNPAPVVVAPVASQTEKKESQQKNDGAKERRRWAERL